VGQSGIGGGEMLRFSGHDINGNRHIGLLAESKGYKGQPEKGFYISNDAGSPWAYQVRAETVSPGIEINGTWCYVDDYIRATGEDYYSNDSIMMDDDWSFEGKLIFEEGLWIINSIDGWIPICDISQNNIEIEVIGNKWDDVKSISK
jgi:hypothetical protein